MCVCVFTSDRSANAVQVCDVRVGCVNLQEEVLHLTVAVVTKLQRRHAGHEEEGGEEEER